MKIKSILCLLLATVLAFSLSCGLAGCSNGSNGITPQLRINPESNYWEVSYENAETWTSLE